MPSYRVGYMVAMPHGMQHRQTVVEAANEPAARDKLAALVASVGLDFKISWVQLEEGKA